MKQLPLTAAQLILVLTVPLVIYFGFGAARKAIQIHELRNQAESLRNEIESLQARHTELEQQLVYYQSDQYVEKIAREQLGLIKPTETSIVMVSKAAPSPEHETAPAKPRDTRPNPQRWWDFLFAS